MQIYELAYTWYEDYVPTLFVATDGRTYTQAEWDVLCDSLVDAAARAAVAANAGSMFWVGWNTIVEEMVKLVEGRGFARVSPIRKNYFGSCIIRRDNQPEDNQSKLAPEVAEMVMKHNDDAENRVQSEV